MSLLEPTQPGCIFYNDIDVTETNVNELRMGIATVPQRRFLFSASILDNVRFSAPHLDQIKAESAVQKACVSHDILEFPNQWNTLVGEKGIILSGGQQHRLALARAYASDYHVLILDDVLSSVDHKTELEMIDHLYNDHDQPTTIIIAHRISALKKCDQIIVLDEGNIIQKGSHKDLISVEGPYKSTWQYQQMEAELNE